MQLHCVALFKGCVHLQNLLEGLWFSWCSPRYDISLPTFSWLKDFFQKLVSIWCHICCLVNFEIIILWTHLFCQLLLLMPWGILWPIFLILFAISSDYSLTFDLWTSNQPMAGSILAIILQYRFFLFFFLIV